MTTLFMQKNSNENTVNNLLDDSGQFQWDDKNNDIETTLSIEALIPSRGRFVCARYDHGRDHGDDENNNHKKLQRLLPSFSPTVS